jgi:hypothetical protein
MICARFVVEVLCLYKRRAGDSRGSAFIRKLPWGSVMTNPAAFPSPPASVAASRRPPESPALPEQG